MWIRLFLIYSRGSVSNRSKPSPSTLVWIGVAILAATWAVYAPVGQHEFVSFDDPDYITSNPHVRRGLSGDGLAWAFRFTLHANNWHPLTWLSHMLDCELFGLDAGRHHLVSVFLHALNAVLLLVALNFMTRAPWPSAFVAALFALHPLRVESVAWVAERKDVLAGMFWMLTLLAYARYVRGPSWQRYVALALTVLAGLLAKPMLVSLPFVLLLLDLWPLRRAERFGRLVAEKIPLVVLAAASSAVTLYVQTASGAVRSDEALPAASRAVNALAAYLTYLWKTVWPSELAFFYPHPALLAGGSSQLPAALGAGLFLAAATVLAVRRLRERPYVLVGWAWFLGTLLPVIGLVQVGEQAWADRYAYLPLVGIYVVVAWGVHEALASWPAGRTAVGAAAGALLLAFAAATWVQVGYWKNSRALYERALAVDAHNYLAHNNLGNLYYKDGNLEAAKRHYEAAVRVRPTYADANYNLGNVVLRQGDPLTARALFERALASQPDHAMANLNIGVIHAGSRDYERARVHFERAALADPGNPEPLHNLGVIHGILKQPQKARSYLERALRIDPGHERARQELQRLMREPD